MPTIIKRNININDIAHQRTNKDNWYHNLRTVDVKKIPIYDNLSQIGDEPGMEGNIILRRDTGEFCYHDGITWVGLGTTSVTLTSESCPVELVTNGQGPDLTIKGFSAGSGISLIDNGGCVTIASASAAGTVTLTSEPCPVELVTNGQGPDLTIKGFSAGSGISLIDNGGCVTIASASAAGTVTLSSEPCEVELVTDGQGPDLVIKGFNAGTGISLIDSGGCVTIASVSTADTVTLSSEPCPVELVTNGQGPDLTIKGFSAGSGISLIDNGGCVTIASASAAGTVTLSSEPCEVELVTDGQGPDLVIKGFSAGSGISLIDNGGCVTIANDSPAISVTLSNACETGIDLVNKGDGPDIRIKGLREGTGILLRDDASCITLSVDGSAMGCPCAPTPLSNADVVAGVINLNVAGINYCLTENITGDINITGANVTVDGKDRVVTGRVILDAADLVLKNAKVKPAGRIAAEPITNAAIEVTSSGVNAYILDCLVECAVSTQSTPAITGRTGIYSAGAKTIIERCRVTAGDGGNALLEPAKITGGAGGIAIDLIGTDGTVRDTMATGGSGGQGSNAYLGNGGAGGPGGDAIQLNGTRSMVVDSVALGGNGGTGGPETAQDGNVAGTGGAAGDAIQINGANCTVDRCTARGGDGGTGGFQTGLAVAGSGGLGGNAIDAASSCNTVIIKLCTVSDGSNGGSRGTGGGGIDGNGGNGIIVKDGSENVQVCECKIDNVGAGTIPGNGIIVANGALCVQIVSNRVSCCPGIGINNLSPETEAKFYNNISTDNVGANYSGVTLVSVPGPQTGFYTNVTQGDPDIDIDCGPIPLTNNDVISGVINLDMDGMVYCLAETITGIIFISGENVTVDGTNRVVNGLIQLVSSNVTLKNIKVIAPAPLDPGDAGLAAIDVLSGTKTHILDCIVECENSTITGLDGRIGIRSVSRDTVVERCRIVAGSGANNAAGNANSGGIGISLSEDYAKVIDSTSQGGSGGTSTNGSGGTGGAGIFMPTGDYALIKNSTGIGGVSGTSTDTPALFGGVGIQLFGEFGTVVNSRGYGGNGGDATGSDDSIPEWSWVKSASSTGVVISDDVATDNANNAYVVGWFRGTATFGTITVTSSGSDDIFVAKYDSAGVVQWVESAGGTNPDRGQGIATDNANNVYITGLFRGKATFGTITVTSSGIEDVFVTKYNPAGVAQWVQTAGPVARGFGIATDNANNVYVTGSFEGTATFGTITVTSSGSFDIFVAKYDSSGVVQWVQTAGGTNFDGGFSIATDNADNVYATGSFRGTATFGTITVTTSSAFGETFVVRYDSAGVAQWVQTAGGGTDFNTSRGVATDNANNVYITGTFDGTTTFGTITVNSSGAGDIFVVKYNPVGVAQWVETAGGIDLDAGFGIATDSSNNVYVTGYFNGVATFGTITVTGLGLDDVFVAKIIPIILPSTTGTPSFGGAGIFIGNFSTVLDSIGVGGQSGNGIVNAAVAAIVRGGSGIQGGLDNITIKNCEGIGGSGGNTTIGDGCWGGGGIVRRLEAGGKIDIENTIGKGGNGGNSTGGGDGGLAGDGCDLLGDSMSVRNCTFSPGNGGTSTTGTGGAGGVGIHMARDIGSIARVAQGVIIQDCVITGEGIGGASVSGTGGQGGFGIKILRDSKDIQICNCKIDHIGVTNTGPGGSGIFIGSDRITTIQIIGCKIMDVGSSIDEDGGCGIYINNNGTPPPKGIQIFDCAINNVGIIPSASPSTAGDGIRIVSNDPLPITCVEIKNTSVIGWVDDLVSKNGYGFFLNNVGGINVINCSAICNNLDGFAMNGEGLVLTNFTSNSNRLAGINLGQVVGFQIKGCKVELNGGVGIIIGPSCSSGQVTGNRVNANGGAGIFNLSAPAATTTFINNFSSYNSPNYALGGAAKTPVALAAATSYWDNVFP